MGNRVEGKVALVTGAASGLGKAAAPAATLGYIGSTGMPFPTLALAAALLLGTSIGGELLNPGAPEFRTVIRETSVLGLPLTGADCVRAVLPLGLLHLGVATAVFWFLTVRAEGRRSEGWPREAREITSEPVSYLKAAVPLVPLAFLFLVAPPLQVIQIPRDWLVGPREAAVLLQDASARLGDPRLAETVTNPFDSRLIGAENQDHRDRLCRTRRQRAKVECEIDRYVGQGAVGVKG